MDWVLLMKIIVVVGVIVLTLWAGFSNLFCAGGVLFGIMLFFMLWAIRYMERNHSPEQSD